jgi:hypothetical protein
VEKFLFSSHLAGKELIEIIINEIILLPEQHNPIAVPGIAVL